MSAVDEYEAVRHDINHSGFPPFSGEQMSRIRDAADAAIAQLTWMLDTFMHNRTRYMKIRGGYADIFNLVKQDLADDYERRFDDD